MSPGFLRHPAVQFALLLIVAVTLRWDTFGDPNMHGDEVFYQTVGVAMHHGVLPYVDVWDRKPFGLFALSWLIAFLAEDMLAFQVVAALFAAGTAWCIARIAMHLASENKRDGVAWLGPVLAGIAYLLWLAPLQGFGGQSPVFYNLFIAGAALLVVRTLPDLRDGRAPVTVALAMLLAGVGLTIKTSALFEAAFLGLFAVWALWRSPAGISFTLKHAAIWAATGAAPALLIAAAYAAMGHWSEYWHAMVLANIDKPTHWPTSLMRLRTMGIALSPILLLALLGLIKMPPKSRTFILWWLVAALLGLFAVPNFYLHYALPLLVPLCTASGAFLGQRLLGPAMIATLAYMSLTIAPFQPGHARLSASAIDRLETQVRAHVGEGPLLLYDAPPQLYVRTGQPFVTPLVFPTHLAHGIERNVSHLDTLAETERVLALKPGAVVMAAPLRNTPYNEETHALVLAYVGRNCRLVDIVPTYERQRTDRIAVWGDCRK